MTPFRLASLLRLRRSQQDQAAALLAAATAARRAASRESAQRRDDLAGHRTPDNCTPRAWTASVAARAALTAANQQARVAQEQTEQRVGAASQTWAATRRRTRALERLEDRHTKRVVSERRRDEQLQVDEHATTTAHQGDQW